MRDLLFVLIFSPLVLLSLIRPWSGLLTFSWIAFLKPQSILMSLGTQVPFTLIIAITTTIGWALSKERKGFEIDLTAILFMVLIGLATLSTAFSLMPEASEIAFHNFLKVMFFLFVLRVMLTSHERLHSYIWLLAFVMGFLGLYGGASFIMTNGAEPIAVPLQSEFGDRDHLALAMLIAAPLINYLRLRSQHRWVQVSLVALMVMIIIAVLATSSYGGFFSLLAMGIFFWWQSKSRILAVVMLFVIGIGLHNIVLDPWKQQIDTTEAAKHDDHALKHQLVIWQTYLNAALDRPLTGAGLHALQQRPIFFHYALSPDEAGIENIKPRQTPSVYFQVLGDLGFVGFAVYIALLVTGFLNARWISQQAKGREDLKWMGDLGCMLQASMIAFSASGAFLSIPFYDYFLSLLVVLSAVRCIAPEIVNDPATRPSQRPIRSAEAVNKQAIAHIWQKAADNKVSHLRGRRSGTRLTSNSGAIK